MCVAGDRINVTCLRNENSRVSTWVASYPIHAPKNRLPVTNGFTKNTCRSFSWSQEQKI